MTLPVPRLDAGEERGLKMPRCASRRSPLATRSISGLSLPAAKQVKLDDVGLPDGAKELKAQAQEMFEWCEELAAGSREGAKEILDDTGNASFAEGILKGAEEHLTVEELARRERMRMTSRGISAYELSEDGTKL
ncbi:MAG: hypothetical protein HC774_07035, partial [Sphingomonadales bacterium]|nr:hypothetical protein [Sphingomonadales bacterium]